MELLRGARRWVVAQLTQMSRSGALPGVSEHPEYIESDCEENEEEEEEEAEDRQGRPAKRAAPEASNVQGSSPTTTVIARDALGGWRRGRVRDVGSPVHRS